MRTVTLAIGGYLVGVSWFWGTGVHGLSDYNALLNPTYPNCSTPEPSYPKYNGSYYIKNQADADDLLGCTAFWGDIVVSECSSEVTSITLKDLKTINDGVLYVEHCNKLQNFSAPVLESIESAMSFLNLSSLTDIQLPLLRSVGGQFLRVSDAPLLSTLAISLDSGFTAGILIENTGLSTIKLHPKSANTRKRDEGDDYFPGNAYPLTIVSNPNLDEILVTGYEFNDVNISNNRPSHINLPSLVACQSLYISSAASLYVPSLEQVRGDLSIVNSLMTNLSLPVLKLVEKDMLIAKNTLLRYFWASIQARGSWPFADLSTQISENPLLSKISLKDLVIAYGRTQIFNNPSLSSLELWSLKSPEYMWISGNFSSLQLPSLSPESYMSILINSTSPDFDCSILDKQHHDTEMGRVRYDLECATYVTGSTTKDTAKHWYPPKTGIAHRPGILAALIIGSIAGATILLALLFWLCSKRSNRRHAEESAAVDLADLPPNYTRLPKPHEIPPVYGQHAPAGSEMTSSSELSAVERPTVTTENAVPEQTRETTSPIAESTIARDPAPPMYMENDQARETRRPAEVARDT